MKTFREILSLPFLIPAFVLLFLASLIADGRGAWDDLIESFKNR